ncbi:GNAT family N-acetyltransferase [Streptococcus gallolyticus]|nr:GNAT family N-acetyltransferase [Streptococcus gallolyticus]MBY5042018.1 GNAT family N-acetyltransferase [Streptococcus gallolyticus]
MKIKQYQKPGPSSVEAMRKLVKICQGYDKTFREPYLSNNLNFDVTMPVFFLAYEDKELLGFLAVYADDTEPELSIYVRPDVRRQGIARKLYQAYKNATAAFDLQTEYFVTESIFIEKHPDFLKAWGLEPTGDVEILMERQRQPFSIEKREDCMVTLASMDHVEAIADFQAQAFGQGESDERVRYAREAVENPEQQLYIVIRHGEVVASCTVDTATDEDYLFGLAVAEECRHQGLGTYLVQTVVNDRIQNGDKRVFQLAVDEENTPAKSLYQHLGFQALTEITYLSV